MKKSIKIILFVSIVLIIMMVGFIGWKRATMLTGLAPELMVNKQKDNIVIETTTTIVTSPLIMVGKMPLCSNQYYETKYDKDGKVVIKDFPYKQYMKTRWNDLYYNLGVDSDDIEQGKINGVINPCEENEYFVDKPGSSQGGPPLIVSYRFCYDKDLSLQHISDLICIQKLELSGIKLLNVAVADMHFVDNCFFEEDNLDDLIQLTSLEEITINGCLLNHNWWKSLNNLKNVKKLTIIDNLENDKVFDSILINIKDLKYVEEIDLMYNRLANSKDIYKDSTEDYSILTQDIDDYNHYDKLCDWIGKGNIGKKFTFLGGEPFNFGLVRSIEFVKDGKIMAKCADRENFSIYNSCQEWIEDIRKHNWCSFAG